jgi:small subunit ribosomal protein S16
MSVRIRLSRHGAKKKPFYRIVAADSRRARDGRFLEIVGTYDPNSEPATITLKEERIQHWLGNGATPSKTVAELMRKASFGVAKVEIAEG